MFKEIAASVTPPYGSITMIQPIQERSHWEQLDSDLKQTLIRHGEAYLHFDYPQILATDYMDFSRTGNRMNFQKKCFDRRIVLNTLVLAECVEDQGRFMDDIINGIILICEESAWQLPAHNTYTRDTPQLSLPDVTRPVIDLFAAETGAILAVTERLLRLRLDKVSPLIHTMIEENLNHRIITPYLNEHFWWMGDGKSPMNNWTIWCSQNIILTVFSRDLPDNIKNAVFQKAAQSADYFLAEYGEDGCCDEGAQYYRHAGLCLFNFIELLNYLTADAFLPLYEKSKIRNIASYIRNVHVDDKYYINFADCSPIAGRCNAREFLFGKRTDNPQLMEFAASDFRSSENPLLTEEHNLYYRLQTIFTHQEMSTYTTNMPMKYKDCYYESVGLMISRDDTYCLAVKAGDNNDSHNHNDTGSFTLYKNGLPMFIDAGVETYTQKTFSPQRYELWPMQSAYHNLLTFGDIMQKNGPEYKAKDVLVTMNETSAAITMELSDAYPDARIKTYRRNIMFHKNKEITISDTFDSGNLPATLSLMTYAPPTWDNSTRTLQIGTLGSCQITGADSIKIQPIPITDPRLAEAWQHEIYRVLVTAKIKELNLTIPV